jgi:hypothetical protein
MIKRTLTGYRRYRVQTYWLRKPLVVLQVEVNDKGYYIDNAGGCIDTVDVDKTFYIDARVEDITLLEKKK